MGGQHEAWSSRSLIGLEPVYLWADGIYVKAGLEKDKAALLVVVAGLRDGRKVVLAVEVGHRESTPSWARILRRLRERGLRVPRHSPLMTATFRSLGSTFTVSSPCGVRGRARAV